MKHLLLLLLFFCIALPLSAVQYGEGADIEPPASAMVSDGDILYMTFCGKKKMVAKISLADPRSPTLLSAYQTGFFPQGLALHQKKLYVTDGRFLSILHTEGSTLSLLMRFLIGNDPAKGPVDVIFSNGKLFLAARNGGVSRFYADKGVQAQPGWARSLTAEQNGFIVVFHDSLLLPDGKRIMIPHGTPRKVRRLPDGRLCLANGFAGIAVIGTDGKPDLTENLNRFSCYGAHVFDIVPGRTDASGRTQFVFLAAGEIGVVTADISNGINLVTACDALKWKNINGILRGKENLVYAADETYGLHVLEIQPDGKTLKLVNSLKLTD
ncbi:MAG: hypothetical protein J6R64_06390 [Lentisphaeria bacterium]|nr:hypothetical protein [Lentisphaeria bacterium]